VAVEQVAVGDGFGDAYLAAADRQDSAMAKSASPSMVRQAADSRGGERDREMRLRISYGRRCTGTDKGDGLVAHSAQ
jgi:hypothetical protein